MGKLRANSEIISDKSKNPVTTSTYIKHGNQWLDDAVNNAIGAAASKADKTYVDSELTKKANKSDTDAALSSKADKSELSTKADKSALEATNASVSANTSNIQELSTESTVLSARMDEFTKLEEGSTTGDAELIDGRIGSDGKTYDNIGGAIRGQVTDLKSDLNEIIGTEYTFEDGRYIGNNGTPIALGAYSITSYIRCDNRKIKARVFVSADDSRTAFYNANYEFISGYNMGNHYGELVSIEIPEGAYYVRFTTSSNATLKQQVEIHVFVPMEEISEKLSKTDTVLDAKLDVSYTIGKYVGTSGGLNKLESYSATDYIRCDNRKIKAKVYVKDDGSRVAFYGINKQYIPNSSYNMFDVSGKLVDVPVPDGAYYVRFSTLTDNIPKTEIYTYIKDNAINAISDLNQKANVYINDITIGKYVQYETGIVSTLKSINVATANVELYDKVIYRAIISTPDSRGLAFYDSNGDFISGVRMIEHSQEIDIPENAVTMKASVTTNEDVELIGTVVNISQAIIDMKKDSISATPKERNITYDAYIKYNSGYTVSYNGFKYVTVNVSSLSYLKYEYVTSTLDNRGLAFYDENDNYIIGYQTIGKSQTIQVPENATICRATVSNVNQLYAYDVSVYDILSLSSTSVSSAPGNISLLSAYSNITCIGDSLTYSQVYTSNTNSRQAYVPYPKVVEKITGTSVSMPARAGATAISWWNEFNSQIIEKPNQLFIIYLGTNAGFTDTLSEDAPESASSYSDYADTNTGVYAKIISKAKSVGGKVILVKCFATSGTGDSNLLNTNKVIEEAGERFGCAVIDSIRHSDNKYHMWPNGQSVNGVHYNDLGYAAFAQTLLKRISELSDTEMKLIIPS